jgi:DNA-binding beta-propeller fold protein YncE
MTVFGLRVVGALALLGALGLPAAAQEPAYVRRFVLPVAEDTIGYPRGVTADGHTGEVFVCDTRRGRILIFDTEGLFLHEIPGGDVFSGPRDLAADPEGYLVVVANYERRPALIELDFDGLFRREVRLSGLPEEAIEPFPVSVALSPTGDRLYTLDSANLRLWIAGRTGEIETSVDLAAGLDERERRDVILGHVDVYGDTVLVALPASSEIRTFGPDGTPRGSVGKQGTAPCTLAFPTAAALDESGDLVIVDQQRMVVVRWNRKSNRCLGDYLGLGAAPGYLYYPMDLALDRSGRIYIAQGFDGRVQMYSGMTPAAPPPPARATAPEDVPTSPAPSDP